MTLATRCSACGTSFRVAQDQLKASGGWVRCGRCNEVFNAIEGLYEIGAPIIDPENADGAPASQRGDPHAPAERHSGTSASLDVVLPALPEGDFASLLPASRDDAGKVVPNVRALPESAQTVDAAFAEEPQHLRMREVTHERTHEPAHEPSPESAPPYEHEADEPLAVESVRPGDDAGPSELAPSFVRAAQRAEQWQQPRRRRLLAFVSLLLLLGLAAQAAVAYRDLVAARWPTLREPLAQACAALGCSVEPMRHIAALAVDSSGLQQVGNDPVYKLSVTLRNRGAVELLLPSLDLVLTDSQGRMIARRVLTMAELGRPSRTVAPLSEISGQVSLSTGEQRVSGYTIEIFYP